MDGEEQPYEGWLPTRYDEAKLAQLLVEAASRRLSRAVDVDVAVVGAGPAGLTASWLLSEKDLRVVVVERSLGTGGGMRGGSMLLPAGLVEEGPAVRVLKRAGVKLDELDEGIFSVDPTEMAIKLAARAVEAGTVIIPGYQAEDLMVKGSGEDIRVSGVVVNLAPILESEWHVDPLFIGSRAVIDATGHDAQLVRLLERRIPGLVKVPGMSSLDVWHGEAEVIEKTGELIPGLFLTGMSVAEVHNTRRMGPVFGGMVVSGAKVARLVIEKLS